MNIYIDIDGVLLTRRQEVPSYITEFITFLINNYSCFWLTTHCRHGQNQSIQYLSKFLQKEEVNSLNEVKEVFWDDLKTDGINFNEDFIWLEDCPFEAEKKVLKQNGKLSSLIKVNLDRADELKLVEKQIKFREQSWKLNKKRKENDRTTNS